MIGKGNARPTITVTSLVARTALGHSRHFLLVHHRPDARFASQADMKNNALACS